MTYPGLLLASIGFAVLGLIWIAFFEGWSTTWKLTPVTIGLVGSSLGCWYLAF